MDSSESPTISVPASRAGWWMRLLGAIIEPWLRIRREASEVIERIDPTVPVCYVTERYGLSDTLILQQACREAGLPEPLQSLTLGGVRKKRSMFALSPRIGWLFGRRRPRAHSRTLAQLIDTLRADPGLNLQLVPVSIFVGRAPDRPSGWFRVLFSENWVVVGRFKRLLSLLLNGRDTIVQFAAPISLREVLDEESNAQKTLRKIARVLRVHFRRIRALIIGPDLSHRRTLIDAVLNAEQVRAAILTAAIKDNTSRNKTTAKARRFAWEIAADLSYPVVRSVSFLLIGFWNKVYDGVHLNHLETLRTAGPGHEIIYVPCHRSHIDYLLLSWLLHQNGFVVPHIAAGVNLNLPVIGPILRRGGAFFMRRSFGDPLYSTVFREYMSQLFARGVSIEYFIEGGRSRTGRTLGPRGGLLSMTVRSYLRESRRPVMFQPVYIGYEKIMEGDSYIGELSGKPKQKESLWGVFKAFGVLRKHYGKVAVNFGEPVFLSPLLNSIAPDWQTATDDPDTKPPWLKSAVDALAERIQINVNRAADVNPINLLALTILSTPKHAMAESDLLAQLGLLRALLIALPYSDRVTVTDLDPQQIIAYGENMQTIRRVTHPLGDVLVCDDKTAVLLSYFRNNVLHLVATAAWVACCFLNNRRMSRANVVRLGRIVYPFIQAELFLPWDEDGFGKQIEATIDFFVEHSLLHTVGNGRIVSRDPGQSDGAYKLRAIAHSMLQVFERYYITIAALVRNGQHTLSSGELESVCALTAQRLSLLHQFNAPEFFDKSLFRGFIQKLRERGVVWTDDEGKLDFDDGLERVTRDARVILSREIRHGILKLTPERREQLEKPESNGESETK